jgi:predicted PurR-regulated permease PerM
VETRKHRAERGGHEPREVRVEAEPTPIWISGRTRNILIIAALILLGLLVWRAPSILFVAAGGMALALVLSFPVRLLSHVMPRPLAIAASFMTLVLLAVLGIYYVVPLLVNQLTGLAAAAPGIAMDLERTLRGALQPLDDRNIISGTPEEFLASLVQDLPTRLRELAERLLGGLVGILRDALGFAVNLLAALIVAVYLLADVRRLKAAYLKVAPHRYRRDARELWEAFGYSLSRYLSGLALVAIVQGTLSGIVLWILNVPYAPLLGAWVAVTAIIPLLGAWLGAIPAVLIALTVKPIVALLTAILFLAIQQLEGNVLTPRVLGGALGVHPILILLAVIGAGQLAGIVGILFAVPTLAVLRVLFDFFRARLRVAPAPTPER